MFTYCAGLKQLTDEPQYLESFTRFISLVLTHKAQAFYTARYDISNNPHLAAIATQSQILTKWQKEYSCNLVEFNTQNNISIKNIRELSIKDYLVKMIIGHGHLPQTLETESIHEFIRAEPDRQQLIKQQTLQNLGGNYSLKAFIELYESDEASIADKIRAISSVKNNIPHSSQLHADLDVLLNHFKMLLNPKSQNKDLTDCSLQFTHDYWKLFMLGTDVQGSCQSSYGDTNYNKCLITYIMSPHIKAIAIVGPDDKILMRAVLRLCFDETTKQAVAHLEDIYSAYGFPKYLERSIYLYAKHICSTELNCDLVASQSFDLEETTEQYPNSVSVLFVPNNTAEYVDALMDRVSESYEITRSLKLFNYQRHLQQKNESQNYAFYYSAALKLKEEHSHQWPAKLRFSQ